MKSKKMYLSLFVLGVFLLISNPVRAAVETMGTMIPGTIIVDLNGHALAGATVILDNQSRTSDDNGIVEFEHFMTGPHTLKVIKGDTVYAKNVNINDSNITVNLTAADTKSAEIFNQTPQGNSALRLQTTLSVIAILALITLVMVVFLRRKHKFEFARKHGMLFMLGLVAILIGVAAVLTTVIFNGKSIQTNAATVSAPTNVKIYPDDEIATLTWTKASGSNVVGYYIRWGEDKGVNTILDNSKQTIFDTAQIQPLKNGVQYIVQIQSVEGTITKTKTHAEEGGSDSFAKSNGNFSSPVQLTVIPSNARVSVMRSKLTGFFDDFKMSAGAFDELKWNHGSTSCVVPGEDGQFINAQFHAHNQTESSCDRDGNVSRPRAIFDINGRTEQDPGIIAFDFDGVTQPRDVWYVDLIPEDAHPDLTPVDVTSHNDLFDADTNPPGRMIRIAQYADNIQLHYYDGNNKPGTMSLSTPCKDFNGNAAFGWCGGTLSQSGMAAAAGMKSPLAEPVDNSLQPFPNLRRHWVIEVSHSKIKVFINGVMFASGTPPSFFNNINRMQLHWTLFSYNTGKQYNGIVGPTTSLIHWDNFGFSGPAPATVVHNYLDGGPDGKYPMMAVGTASHKLSSSGTRSTIIPIPDQIGNPVRARLMFTLQEFDGSTFSYTWSSSHSITINGKKFNFPNPATTNTGPYAIPEVYVPVSTYISLSPGDLKQGDNAIQFGIPGVGILNAHIELEYTKGTEPDYTQPKDVFNTVNYKDIVTPLMRSWDSYWFVEQDMGITATQTTPVPNAPTSTPIPVATVGPTSIPSATPRPSNTPTPRPSNTPTPRPTNTPAPGVTLPAPTVTPIPTSTPRPTNTPTPTTIPSPTPTRIPTSTPVPTIPLPTPSPVANGQTITIYAAGQSANGSYPTMKLWINGKNVKSWTVKGNATDGVFQTFTYTAAQPFALNQMRIRFTNDYYGSGGDRNLRVDRVVVGGTTYQSEASTTYSTGTWNSTTGCAAGNKSSEWLQCNGYFQYQ